jgi:amino acid adenylation domain-containing protein
VLTGRRSFSSTNLASAGGTLDSPQSVVGNWCDLRPPTVAEELVACIWGELLNRGGLGPYDDFFALGGYPGLVPRMLARVKQVFNADLPVSSIFEAPVLSDFANLACGRESVSEWSVRPGIAEEAPVMSCQQSRAWRSQRHSGDARSQSIQMAWRLDGNLNIEAMRRAWEEVVRRHEILRTTFDIFDDKPVPQPRRATRWDLRVSKIGEEELAARLDELARRRFDLKKDIPIRVSLMRLAPSVHVLLVVLHSVAADEISASLLIREVSELCAGREPELSPVPYAGWVLSEMWWLGSPEAQRQLDYWKRTLAGCPALDLPLDRPRLAAPTLNRAKIGFRVDAGAVRELAARLGMTPHMVFLGAFAVLIRRYCRQDDFVIGTLSPNRACDRVTALIGPLASVIPLRIRCRGNPTFVELLHKVRETVLDAERNDRLPFEKVLAAEQNISTLVRVMCNWVPDLHADPALPGIQATRIEDSFGGSTCPFAESELTFDISGAGRWFDVNLDYNSELFERNTAERMGQQLGGLLNSVAGNPGQKIMDLPMLTSEERQRLLFHWNTVPSAHQTFCVHRLFEEQVSRTPDRTAVSFGQERLSYFELNARANRLAHRLRAKGVGPEKLVTVCLGRSVDLVVALVAVLKSGGAYVPIDPAYPEERRRIILEDCNSWILIDQEFLEQEPLEGFGDTNPLSETTPANLAYVIYTSGSTGTPKGVEITHACVSRLFSATADWFQFDENDVWTLFHSAAFDFSVWELWGPLLTGGKLVVVSYAVSRVPEEFRALLSRERVTVLNQTPSAFRGLISADATTSRDYPLSLRYVIFGGEKLEFEILRPWFERHGDDHPRLINMYGITETTVHVTWRPVRMADLAGGCHSMIGARIPDLQVYVLDEYLNPVPVGVPGELCIAGAGLARGYLNRPELTREKFVPHPFSSNAGQKLYRSGDLGRFHANGDIQYLGRIDQQVKIRGFRIEPGEIEHTLARHPEIAQCVVQAAKGPDGEVRLAAWVAAKAFAAPTADSLREFLRCCLPEYMLPSAFLVLNKLPLNENGKVDREALPPAWPQTRVDCKDQVIKEQNGTCAAAFDKTVEENIAAAWSIALGMNEIVFDRNFFDLGGDSLRLLTVRAELQKIWGREVSLTSMLQYPTVQSFAAYIRDGRLGSRLSNVRERAIRLRQGLSRRVSDKTGES